MSSMPPAVNKEKKALTRKYASGTKQEHLFYITFSYHRQFDHTQKKLRTLNERKKLLRPKSWNKTINIHK